jgi:hypothetical protein
VAVGNPAPPRPRRSTDRSFSTKRSARSGASESVLGRGADAVCQGDRRLRINRPMQARPQWRPPTRPPRPSPVGWSRYLSLAQLSCPVGCSRLVDVRIHAADDGGAFCPVSVRDVAPACAFATRSRRSAVEQPTKPITGITRSAGLGIIETCPRTLSTSTDLDVARHTSSVVLFATWNALCCVRLIEWNSGSR